MNYTQQTDRTTRLTPNDAGYAVSHADVRGDELPYSNRTGAFLRLCADWETEEALTPAQRVSELERLAEIARGNA